jgi:hypothetical protein
VCGYKWWVVREGVLKKSHIGCEMFWICVYKVDAILTLQAGFVGDKLVSNLRRDKSLRTMWLRYALGSILQQQKLVKNIILVSAQQTMRLLQCENILKLNFTNRIKWHYYTTILFNHHCTLLVYSITTNSNVLKIHRLEIVKSNFFHYIWHKYPP